MPPSLRQKSLGIFVMASSQVTFLQMHDPRLTPTLKTEEFTSRPFSKTTVCQTEASAAQLEAPPAPCEQGNYQTCLLPPRLARHSRPCSLISLHSLHAPFPPAKQTQRCSSRGSSPLLSRLGLCPRGQCCLEPFPPARQGPPRPAAWPSSPAGTGHSPVDLGLMKTFPFQV